MKIGAAIGPYAPPAGPAAREVAPERTRVDREQIRGAIRRALAHTEGAPPPEQLVDVLTAHASLETASGDRMYNFNFGGIKGRGPSGATAKCRTREVIEGREIVIRDGFRAYGSLDEGALDYVRTMKTRFGGALAPAARGDVAGFAGALKRAGYYTASEADYARGLTGLLGASGSAREGAAPRAAGAPTAGLGVSALGLSRVGDALDADRVLDAMGRAPLRSRRVENDDEDA
ncbi:MAG: hypothetical protein KF819_06970 [Labilithrix sp.]|nr:hypothetical protein [Labilithrix sp.]